MLGDGVWRSGMLAVGCLLGFTLSARTAEPVLPDGSGPLSAEELRLDRERYEALQLLVDSLEEIDRNYVTPVDRRRLVEAAIRGMVRELDANSKYVPPEQVRDFRSDIESEFGGIGVQIGLQNNQLVVTAPLLGTPAHRAGVLAGDILLEINGQPTAGLSINEAIDRLKGEVDTEVAIKFRRPHDQSEPTVKLKRELIKVATVLGDRRHGPDEWDFIYDQSRKIAYLRITTFGRNTAEELQAVLENLSAAGVQGVVLDLRFNPGGLLSEAIEVCDMFIDSGRIVSTQGRNSKPKYWEAKKDGAFTQFRLAVLVNRYSASAAEIVAACLQDHGRAAIVGERTWGKGSVQSIIDLEGGRSALKLTTSTYFRPSGKNIHRHEGDDEDQEWGVLPNHGLEVKLTEDDLQTLSKWRRQRDIPPTKNPLPESEIDFEDRQLSVAVDYLRGELASVAAAPE